MLFRQIIILNLILFLTTPVFAQDKTQTFTLSVEKYGTPYYYIRASNTSVPYAIIENVEGKNSKLHSITFINKDKNHTKRIEAKEMDDGFIGSIEVERTIYDKEIK